MWVKYNSSSGVQPKKQWYVPILGEKLSELNLLIFYILYRVMVECVWFTPKMLFLELKPCPGFYFSYMLNSL